MPMEGRPARLDKRLAKTVCVAIAVAAIAGCSSRGPQVAQRVVLIAPPVDLPKAEPAPETSVPARAAVPATPPEPAPSAAAPPAAATEAAATPSPVPPPPVPPPPVAVAALPPPPPSPARVDPPASAEGLPAEVIYFQSDAYKVDGRYRAALENHARKLKASPRLRMVIQAHADSRGERDYNLALSKKRADTVAKFLTSRGVAAEQLEIVYHGEGARETMGGERVASAAHRRVELRYVDR